MRRHCLHNQGVLAELTACATKNDAVVRFSLPENNKTIIASQYKLYLPTEQQLLDELHKELDNFTGRNIE